MRIESDTTIAKPREEVFDYIAHAEWLPEYVTEFKSVEQESPGEPANGTRYRYEMKRGGVSGTFDWTEFERPSRLAWSGPPVKQGPGSMQTSGYWDLADEGAGTRVKLVMTPEPGGLFKLMAPLMQIGMRKGNTRAMERLKERLERPS